MMLTTIGLRRLRIALAASVLAVLGLAGCGGGSGDQVDPFRPSRVFGFGDEATVLNADGTKYSINGFATGTTTVDCSISPLWIQVAASAYGFVFPQCNPNNVTAPPNRILATVGARAADLVAQIDGQVNNGGGFTGGDLSFVYIGTNDVVAQFQRYPAVGEPELTAEVQAAGRLEAGQINRLADLGTKVVVVTIPNLGLAPIAGGRTTDSAALLGRLTNAYNTALRSNIFNDGRRIGLALLDEYVQAVATAADAGNSGLTFVNARDAACAVPLPNCTPNTLVSAVASPTTWLWADDIHLGAGGQNSLGAIASSRATTNPF